MFGLFFRCIRIFGLRGILIYVQLKLGLTNSIRIPGIQYPVSLRPQQADKISFKEIFMKREYDVTLPATLIPTVIVDGGANVGFTSVFFANKYPSAKIFSIEPDAANFTCLVNNTRNYATITPIKGALWYKAELLNVVDKGYGDRGFVIEKNDEANTLQATSLADLMQHYQLTHLDILKLDIEGSEKEVFSENYQRWLPRTKCLIIELHDRMKPGCSQAVFSALTQYNFSFSIKGENLVFTNNDLT